MGSSATNEGGTARSVVEALERNLVSKIGREVPITIHADVEMVPSSDPAIVFPQTAQGQVFRFSHGGTISMGDQRVEVEAGDVLALQIDPDGTQHLTVNGKAAP